VTVCKQTVTANPRARDGMELLAWLLGRTLRSHEKRDNPRLCTSLASNQGKSRKPVMNIALEIDKVLKRRERFPVMEDPPPILMALTQRIRAEYQEAPGLRLTVAQGTRFWGLDFATCEYAFETLEHTGFLSRCSDGSYRHARRP